jgi:predicted Rossmann-fold nucleotide-binding protein
MAKTSSYTKYNKYIVNISLLLFTTICVFALIYVIYRMTHKKTIAIFGSVSKDITNDVSMKQDLDKLVASINGNKYNYIVPNATGGIIGYVLDHVKEKEKYSFTTTYVKTFTSPINKSYKTITFDDGIDFEEYMVRKSNYFIFLPGGVGTLYEVSFVLLTIDIHMTNTEMLLFYNKNNYFDFIKELMKRYKDTGYLRQNVYDTFLKKSRFCDTMDELITYM